MIWIPSLVLDNKSLYFIMTHQSSNLHDLKLFSSLVFAYTLQAHRNNLAHRARKRVFLGYKTCMKSTYLFDINNKDIFISRNLIHHEQKLSYQLSSSLTTWTYHPKFGHFTTRDPTNVDQTHQSIIFYNKLLTGYPNMLEPRLETSLTNSNKSIETEL